MTEDKHATRLLDVRARLGDLNVDELEAFDVLLAKLESGKAEHGELNLTTDRRNFREEGREELRDWIWYFAFDEVIARRQARQADPPAQPRHWLAEAP